MSEDAKQRRVVNIAARLAKVGREDVIARSIGRFCNADPDYGVRVEVTLKALRQG
jgi:catalase